jgi:hypothetical protein
MRSLRNWGYSSHSLVRYSVRWLWESLGFASRKAAEALSSRTSILGCTPYGRMIYKIDDTIENLVPPVFRLFDPNEAPRLLFHRLGQLAQVFRCHPQVVASI